MSWICGLVDEEEFDELDELDVPLVELLAPVLDPPLVRPEPVPVPLRLSPDVPVPPSCWPTVRLTTATVPAIGAVSDAPDRAAWALANWAWAAVSDAWSELACALDAPLDWSEESRAAAESTVACAWATWLCRAAESTVASTAPCATC